MMVCKKNGIFGLGNNSLIDKGTLSLLCSLPPKIEIFKEDVVTFLLKQVEEHKQRVKHRRDAIIDYQVDKRIDKLGDIRGNQIRCRKNGVKTYGSIKHRDLNKIDALVLHQIAFNGGEGAERYYDVSVHYIITPNGTIFQNHDESVYCYGSGAFNSWSVAVEFVGNFKNDRGKWWKHKDSARALKSELTKEQVYSGRKLVLFLKESLGIKYVFAHRQASTKKSNCPGPEIWYNVGEWALKNGLTEGRTKDFKLSKGKSIPKEWRDKKYDVLNTSNNSLLPFRF